VTTYVRITDAAEVAALPRHDDGDGFVHLSEPHQVLTAANTFYAGRTDLDLLVLDAAKLDGEIRVEGGFPHLYGTLPADAITDAIALPCDPDGAFRLALVPAHAGSPPASDLIAGMIADLEPLYGRIDGADTPSASPAEMWRPGGTFLVGWDADGRPVCGGGVKRLDGTTAEIKRMFVVPEARSAGHARRLLAGLEDAARRLGYSSVRLDTGPKQPHAKALYESAGYVEIPDYNANPKATYWGEKHL
jgi:uncharacterized protein (DUF952 family)/GNAT superfamily N-acetyltransferase